MSMKEPEPVPEVTSQEWIFTVSVLDVGPKEKVCITGSTPELGEWDNNRIVIMNHESGTDFWRATVTIPNTCDIYYRYAICLPSEDTSDMIIRHWESNIHPRVIKEDMLHPTTDIFGDYDGKNNVGSGWLTAQTLVQFKFVKNPLKLKSRLSGRLMNIKVTPVKLSFGNELQVEDSSQSIDTTETQMPTGVFVDVSTLDNDPVVCMLKPQEQFGREYKLNDIMLVNVVAPDPKSLAYLIDFFSYSTRASSEDPPCHVGYTYVLPNMFKLSEGNLELPVTCNVKHRPLGTINFEYLIVRPMTEKLCDLQVSYTKHWDPSWTGLEVGHRGLGASFKTKEGNAIRENTIASLKKAAASGADLLEFDVQLSKDFIPVIYHDFYVCISMKRKKEVEFTEMLELPVKDLTFEHLQKLKVYHLVEGRSHEILFFDDELEEHQPFPTLEQALNSIDLHVGFNVELKWTMEMDDGTFELNNPFDMNTYVDKVLEVVLKNGGQRRIVFSCFNPDICTMVRYKQNKYPVMFLTVGITKKYKPYRDPRCLSIPAAVQNAVSSDILGIVVHTEDLLRDPTQVKLATDAGLVIFCWGDDNNDKNTIKMLKEMGLHAVIYDKLDQYTTKEVKESIFLVEARESQRDLMRLAALEDLPASESSTSVYHTDDANRPFLDLSGITKKYKPYRDPRCLSIPAAVQNAVSSDILGIVVHTEDLLRDPTQVKLATDAGLVIFCWGDDNNDKNTIKMLKEMGLHAVIYDKLDQYTTKEVKESIFLVEARESQRDLMRLAALEDLPASESSTSVYHTDDANRPFLDLSVRDKIKKRSTVTSLESLASSIEIRDDPADKNLKRNRDNIITNVEKESQVKEQRTSFRGIFPVGDISKQSTKKSRKNEN